MSGDATDWIKPGAEVVVWRQTYGGKPDPKLTTVASVAKKSFVADGISERIQFDGLESKRLGSTWSGYRYVVEHPESEKARALLDGQRRDRLAAHAFSAVEAWRQNRTRENRLAAIEALQQVED